MCLIKTESFRFDSDNLVNVEKIAGARKRMRTTTTPAAELQDKVQRLFNRCLKQLPEAFAANQVNLEAFIELDRVYALDVIEGLRAKFAKGGFEVEYTYQDGDVNYDHLGFTPPKDWITRLLAMADEGEKALAKATQHMVDTI